MAIPRAADTDISSLILIAGEIDRCLAGAAETLEQWSAKAVDAAGIDRAREELAVLRGAMEVILLEAVPRVVQELEALFGDLARRQIPTEDDAAAAGRYAIGALRKYVAGLVAHSPQNMVALAQILQELFKARGSDRFAALELFQPDLSPLPPGSPQATAAGNAREILRFARAGFQKGLLAWLRRGEDKGLVTMRAAIERAEAACATPLARAPWWVAGGLLDLLIEGALKTDVRLKRLCSALDQSLRRAIEGVADFPRQLMKEMLFFVATATGASERTLAIRRTYGIETLPAQAWKAEERNVPFMRQFAPLRDLQEVFEQTAGGDAAGFAMFRKGMAEIMRQAPANPQLNLLLQTVVDSATRLAEGASARSDALAVETATTMLFLQDIMARWNTPDAELIGRMEAVTQRLRCVADGDFDGDAPEWAGLFGAARRNAQNNALIQHVACELISILVDAEQRLNRFFEDDSNRSELVQVDSELKQTWGTLMVLGEEAAATAAGSCRLRIGNWNGEKDFARQEDYIWLATQLSGLRFFLEQLRFGRADFQQIMAKAGQSQYTHERSAAHESPGAGVIAASPPISAPGEAWNVPDDRELLGAVIEEAQKLLADLHAALIRLRAHEDPAPLLANVRRYFHTMKGGFNMVDLIAMGKAAGDMERMVSDEPDRAPAPELLDLLDIAHGQICQWVEQLARDGKVLVDASALSTLVRRQREDPGSQGEPQAHRPSPVTDLRSRAPLEWREQGLAVRATLQEIAESIARLREQAREIEAVDHSDMVTPSARHDENARQSGHFVRRRELARFIRTGADDLGAVQRNLLQRVDSGDYA